MPITVETCVAQHIGDRQEQQDRVALIPHPSRQGTLLAVLADGMGGHTGGAMAAEQVLHKARQNFGSFMSSESPRDMLQGVINESHIVIKLTRFTSEQDPHSTAAVLLLQPDRIDWAYCGDSRVYHFRGSEMVSCSEDHSYVNHLVKHGKIKPEEAHGHPQRNVLMGCLGSDRAPVIDFGETAPPKPSDIFLLCSDGLWGHFKDHELGEVLSANAPRQAAEILIHRARVRGYGGGDNISLVIIKLSNKLPAKSPRPAKPVRHTPAGF